MCFARVSTISSNNLNFTIVLVVEHECHRHHHDTRQIAVRIALYLHAVQSGVRLVRLITLIADRIRLEK